MLVLFSILGFIMQGGISMSLNFNEIRDKLDSVVMELATNPQIIDAVINGSSKILEKFGIIGDQQIEEDPLYAWVPVPSLACAGSVGVTADCMGACASACCAPRPPQQIQPRQPTFTPAPAPRPPYKPK